MLLKSQIVPNKKKNFIFRRKEEKIEKSSHNLILSVVA